jgi:EAL domain-containing protein (putative c-di-GMP-specific phosphodiesterase class I)
MSPPASASAPISSIGISAYLEHGALAETLFHHADIALYRAKARGNNQVCVFQPAMNRHSGHKVLLETDLRHAIERNQFHVLYQPQIDLQSRQIVGVEALVRWQHPLFGATQPSRFISIAEETGLICSLGGFVLKAACAELRLLSLSLKQPLRLAVNLSPRQIHDPTLFATVAETLEVAGIDPEFLEFEITENAFIDGNEAAIRQIYPLTEMGMGLVLDDFGTGYSSLSRLKHCPIRRIKIDRSFVGDIGRSESDEGLVRATVAIAKCLGIGVIAEGIETRDQLTFLSNYGCSEGQGLLIGRPASAKQITRLLLRQARIPMASSGCRR